jgi:hypothetical protein
MKSRYYRSYDTRPGLGHGEEIRGVESEYKRSQNQLMTGPDWIGDQGRWQQQYCWIRALRLPWRKNEANPARAT